MAEAADGDFRLLMDYAHGFMVSQVGAALSPPGCCSESLETKVLGAESPWYSRCCAQFPPGAALSPPGCCSESLETKVLGAEFPRVLRSVLPGVLGRVDPEWASGARSLFPPPGCCAQSSWVLLGVPGDEGPLHGLQPRPVRGTGPRRPRPSPQEAPPLTPGPAPRARAERLLFMHALQDTWSVYGARVLTAFDLSEFRVICDVGSGSGALAAACARLHPASSVSMFDTCDVVAAARAHFRRPRGDPPVRFLGGDFFRSPLPRADLYILGRVLHDWTDADAARLLGRIGRAGGPDSAVLLVEAVLTPGGRGPARALLMSLTMLLQTRGRERMEAEFRAMAAAAGFAHFQRRPTGGDLEVMLAKK
ncbi:acetylserotonin O-methyltransferase-like [Microtus oregoni]|uniref:acetylserotonin O-methyltransferase-like n=1 Tax=Microtus oregoni TaxID=111838 RepID=UPI001BB1FF1A|nr:acetylserotonin O-methyltransferase-like [Microtus oregoni]